MVGVAFLHCTAGKRSCHNPDTTCHQAIVSARELELELEVKDLIKKLAMHATLFDIMGDRFVLTMVEVGGERRLVVI